jgi:hypothetical protein
MVRPLLSLLGMSDLGDRATGSQIRESLLPRMKTRSLLFCIALIAVSLWRVAPLSAKADTYDASLREMVAAVAVREGVDPALVEAIVAAESDFNPRAVSPKGARGLMQLMPQTASFYGVSDSFDPEKNLTGGIRHLRDLLRYFGGDLSRSLAAYNAGAAAVVTYGGLPPYRETQQYVKKVLARYRGGQVPPSPPSVHSSGQQASEAALVEDEAREDVRFARVSRAEPSASDAIDSESVARLRQATSARPLTEIVRAPLVQTRRAPLVFVTSRQGLGP